MDVAPLTAVALAIPFVHAPALDEATNVASKRPPVTFLALVSWHGPFTAGSGALREEDARITIEG